MMRDTTLILVCLLLAACAGPAPTPETPATLPPTTPLPETVLVEFNRQGGFAFSDQTLTIRSDGTARLDIHSGLQGGAGEWQLSAAEMEALTALLDDPGLAGPPGPNPNIACDDCYEYVLNARTPRGVLTIEVDDADLLDANGPPPALREIIGLLNRWMTARG